MRVFLVVSKMAAVESATIINKVVSGSNPSLAKPITCVDCAGGSWVVGMKIDAKSAVGFSRVAKSAQARTLRRFFLAARTWGSPCEISLAG